MHFPFNHYHQIPTNTIIEKNTWLHNNFTINQPHCHRKSCALCNILLPTTRLFSILPAPSLSQYFVLPVYLFYLPQPFPTLPELKQSQYFRLSIVQSHHPSFLTEETPMPSQNLTVPPAMYHYVPLQKLFMTYAF